MKRLWPTPYFTLMQSYGRWRVTMGGVSKPDRGMVNPPEMSDSGGKVGDDSVMEDWEIATTHNNLMMEDWDKEVKHGGGLYDVDKVVNGGMDDGVNDVKRGKVCIRVGEFADWLRTNEPTIIDEYTHHIRTTASTIPLEQWADIHHPELREIWAIVRYQGDI